MPVEHKSRSAPIDPAILDFFASLPKQGPGTDRETALVLDRLAGDLPSRPRIADLGCGTGRAALALAERMPQGTVIAIDRAESFVRRLRQEARRRGLADRLEAWIADMAAPPIAAGSLDLLWCEGAAYAIGFGAALSLWRPLLKPAGYCVVSECEWLTDDRPAAVADFWRENYPDMATRHVNIARAEAAGYAVVGTHALSRRGWEEYYGPIGDAIADGRAAALGHGFEARLREELAVFGQGRGSFGYVFYIMKTR